VPQNEAISQTLTPAPQGASLETLLAKEQELSDQLANLQGERSAYSRQVRSGNAELRSQAQQQVTQLDIQISRAQTALRSVRTQLGTRIPARVFTNNPAYQNIFRQPDNGQLNGDQVAAIIVTFTLAVLMPISIGFTRRLWRRSAPPAPVAAEAPNPRLDRIENAVEAIAIEIERVSEGQRFVTKVMTERSAPARATTTLTSAPPEEGPALGEAKPFLALGAGPIEAIPVAQRQAVRQSITPH
jgi:chromosome segregation ATPase